jgi:RimJ/RimL family protein N-acetyltransferase
MTPIIETKRLVLRNWEVSDIPSLTLMNEDKEVMRYFLSTLNAEQTLSFYQRIQNHFIQHGFGLLVVEDKMSKAFMGYTGFMIAEFESDFTPCVEIGWRFQKAYWGNGFATEAAQACLDYGFNVLDFKTVYSFTSILNLKSEAVMKRIGMVQQGTFGHPKISSEHPLHLHVKYQIEKL